VGRWKTGASDMRDSESRGRKSARQQASKIRKRSSITTLRGSMLEVEDSGALDSKKYMRRIEDKKLGGKLTNRGQGPGALWTL